MRFIFAAGIRNWKEEILYSLSVKDRLVSYYYDKETLRRFYETGAKGTVRRVGTGKASPIDKERAP